MDGVCEGKREEEGEYKSREGEHGGATKVNEKMKGGKWSCYKER